MLIFTVATKETDGYKRYLRSIDVYGFRDNLRVLGMGTPWLGGDHVKTSIGGGYKVNLLKKALEEYQNDDDRIIIFTDRFLIQWFLICFIFKSYFNNSIFLFQLRCNIFK